MLNQSINLPQHLGVLPIFLSHSAYRTLSELSKKRTDCYLGYCDLINAYYLGFKTVGNRVAVKGKIEGGVEFVKGIRVFVRELAKVLEEVSAFKIQYFEQIKQEEIDLLSQSTIDFLPHLSTYSKIQQSFQSKMASFESLCQSLISFHTVLKKEIKDPVVFFDSKYMKSKSKDMANMIKDREAILSQIRQIGEKVYQNAGEFDKEVVFYRQKVISAKYKLHKKFYQLSKTCKEELTQTLMMLYDTVSTQYSQFLATLPTPAQNPHISLYYRRSQNPGYQTFQSSKDALSTIIISATQEYFAVVDEMGEIVAGMIDGWSTLQGLGKENVQAAEKAKGIVEELNKLYESHESPTPDVIDTIDLFNFFCQKLGQMTANLHMFAGNITKLRQNVMKHAQITLSLIKCSNFKSTNKYVVQSKTADQNTSFAPNLEQVDHLFEQMSYDYPRNILSQIYKSLQENLGYLKHHFNAKYHKKRKNIIEDSMEISHVEDCYVKPEKKVGKKEAWLWRDWKDEEAFKIKGEEDKQKLAEIQAFVGAVVEVSDKDKQIEKFSCSLLIKKGAVKGLLKLTQKSLIFQSSTNANNLAIPLQLAEEVRVNMKIFDKQLQILTAQGTLYFKEFPDISKAQFFIEQKLAAVQALSNKNTTKKLTIVLSAEEQAFIKSRKSRIEAQLPKLDDFIEQGSLFLPNTTVQQVYDLAYSDKPVKIKGRQEPCYLAYVNKKLGGFNYKACKYTPPGPKYFTLDETSEISFKNCALFSQRLNEYELNLPPIPFMPKSCNSIQQVKLYWVSDEQFQYYITSISKGAPYADSFYINIMHKIMKKQEGSQIQILSKITFVEDIRMKGMVNGKASEQLKTNITVTLQEISKLCKSMEGNGQTTGKAAIDEQKQEESKQKSKMQSSTIKSLKNQNKILIGVLVAVFILNLIFKLM